VVRTGAELRVPFLNSQFRAGAIYDPSPFKNQDMAFDRIYATLGYGLLVNHMFKLDLAYMLGFWKQYNTGAITREEIKENILYQKLFLNLSYRF
jgi:long-subunit fatty acid transport protein